MDEFIKLLLAVLVGGLIGWEREFRHGRGLQTMMLVCLGTTMFTMYSTLFAWGEGDPRRIPAAVVTGVGFLGVGLILREEGRVLGLTSAASIWAVAALGMGIGIELYGLVAAGTILVLLVLWGVPGLAILTRARKTVGYRAVCLMDEEKYEELTGQFQEASLTINSKLLAKQNERMICTWEVYGDPDDHDRVRGQFYADPAVLEFVST